MDNFHHIVKLMRKYKSHSLLQEEVVELEAWLEEDRHRVLFERIMKEGYERKMIKELDDYNPDKAYRKFLQREERKSRWSVRSWMKVAAISFLTIGVGTGLWFAKPIQTPSTIVQHASIPAGGSKAILTLASGKKLVLGGKESPHILPEQGVNLTADSTVLTYQATEDELCDIQYNELYVPRKGEFSLQLSDGSKVYLNASSRLVYPTAFAKGERRVILMEGEAYFEVAKDSLSPFIVTVGDVSVQVLGTVFNVKAYAEEESVTTTLVSGKVRIRQNDVALDVLPGEQVNCQKENPEAMSKRNVDTELYTAWKNGLFKFERESLKNIATILERWYDIHFVFTNPNLEDYLFSGYLKRYDCVGEPLRLLEMTTNVRFEVLENHVYVYYK